MKRITAAVAVTLALQGAAAAEDTIKLGVVNIDGGPYAVSGAYVNDGATFAVEQLNADGGALGRKYELVIQNHDGKPASAIDAAKKLVEQDGVSFFTGLNPSGTSLAIESKLAGMNALFIDATAASNDLTGKDCTPNYFRIGITDGMQVNAFIELAKESGVKSWDLMMADIAVGHDSAKLFTAAAEARGAKVNKTLYAPITASDLGSYISQLAENPAEGLFTYYPSSGGITFIKQQAPFKLFEKYKMVLSSSMVNEILIGAHGDASVGLWSAQSYFWTLPGEINAKFVQAFRATVQPQADLHRRGRLSGLRSCAPGDPEGGFDGRACRSQCACGAEGDDDRGRRRDARGRSPVAASPCHRPGDEGCRGQGRNHPSIDPRPRRDRAGCERGMQDVGGA